MRLQQEGWGQLPTAPLGLALTLPLHSLRHQVVIVSHCVAQ